MHIISKFVGGSGRAGLGWLNLKQQGLGWCREREKIDWQEPHKFGCRLVRTIFLFVVPQQFSQDIIGEWPENQILIPDWPYFHCPGATLLGGSTGLSREEPWHNCRSWKSPTCDACDSVEPGEFHCISFTAQLTPHSPSRSLSLPPTMSSRTYCSRDSQDLLKIFTRIAEYAAECVPPPAAPPNAHPSCSLSLQMSRSTMSLARPA